MDVLSGSLSPSLSLSNPDKDNDKVNDEGRGSPNGRRVVTGLPSFFFAMIPGLRPVLSCGAPSGRRWGAESLPRRENEAMGNGRWTSFLDKVNDKVNDEVRMKMNVSPLLAGAEGAAHVSPARGAGIL